MSPNPTPPPQPDQGRCRPVLKWAGGKGRLLGHLLPELPSDVAERRFIEPFAGGLALFFALEPRAGALVGDTNPALVDVYRAVSRNHEAVSDVLELLAAEYRLDAHAAYYGTRERYNAPSFRERPLVERAAIFIFLNRTCFNGLHRVNKAGAFNVPAGRYKNPRIVDREGLARASVALRRALVLRGDFTELCDFARAGDVVYLDPPYDPISETARFTAYAGAFDAGDQARVAETFRALVGRGVHVVASNADTPRVRALYAGARILEIRAPRSIGAAPKGRSQVRELLICSP